MTGPVDCNLCSTAQTQACDECRALWSWMDGTAMTDANGDLIYSNWRSSEPNSDTGCLKINYLDGEWRDQTCTTGEPFICERGLRRISVPGAWNFCDDSELASSQLFRLWNRNV